MKSTQKITSAMKMVAASRLKRAESRANAIKPYSNRLRSFLEAFSIDPENLPHPLAEVRPEVRNKGLLIITSDKGLCGSYNSNILRRTKTWLDEQDPERVRLYVVGKKGWDIFKKNPELNIVEKYIDLSQALEHKEIKNISDTVSKAYIGGEVDEFHILYSRFKSAAVCYPTVDQLLPVVPEEKDEESDSGAEFTDTIVEPSPEAVLGILFPKHMHTKILMALAQSFASEQGQRMVAMTNATEAAKEMVENLTLVYNKARQAAITKEISEIVGGAEALVK